MLKSKHSGWTWEMKRTPYGGGGSFLSSIDPGKAISSVGNAFDKNITQPIGHGLAQTDKFMTNLTPYGWALPAAILAAYFTAGGSLAAEGAIEGGALAAGEIGATEGATALATEAATTAGSEAFANGIAAGMSEAEATAAANAAADASLASSTGLEAGTGLDALVPSSGEAINPATGVPWEETGSGLSGNGAQLTSEEFAKQAGINEVTAKDIFTNASRAKSLANLLNPSGGKPTAQQFAQFQQSNQPIQEQFGGLYRMNQNPFAQTQQAASIQNPLARTQDFLAQLAQEGKPTPTLADLVRTA